MYHFHNYSNIAQSLAIIAQQANQPFYLTPEFFTSVATLMAVIVALATPWIMYYLDNKPKESKLIVRDTSVVNQDDTVDDDEYSKNLPHILNVGRIIIENIGKHKASLTEAYIDKIIFNGEERENFFPVPLVWTHGQLHKNGPHIKDIYPNQKVYLDVFNHIYDDEYVDEHYVSFAVATGHNFLALSRLCWVEYGTELLIKLYQESGQVNSIHLKISWDGTKIAPVLTII